MGGEVGWKGPMLLLKMRQLNKDIIKIRYLLYQHTTEKQDFNFIL
jgi:hypothetical protein